jgi:dihydrolipoamide dehydrogenase
MDTIRTEIAVIGAGTAGGTAFSEIKRAGRSAVLIDRGPLGTTCARVGCMPSKAALHAGHRWDALRALGGAAPGGQRAPDLWREAMATRDLLAAGAARRTRTAAGDRLLMGAARFVGPDTLELDGQRVQAQAFVVATGSRPVLPAALAALGDRVLTTDTLFARSDLPRSIAIIGLGAIGLELGLALSRLGVRVVAGDVQPAIAGIRDPIILQRALERCGRELAMWLGAPMQARAVADGIEVTSGERHDTVEMVLAALGRRPNVEGLALEHAGVAVDGSGQPMLDPVTLRAGAAPVFFAGDVHPDRPLLHEAAAEGVIAARGAIALVTGAPAVLPARGTPLSIVFSDPDVCAVGAAFDRLDAEQVVIGTAQGSANGRSRIMGTPDNLIRVYAQRGSGRLMGASLLSARGEHIAHLLAWAIQRKETVAGLLELPFYHPTIEELLQSALRDAAVQLATTEPKPPGRTT